MHPPLLDRRTLLRGAGAFGLAALGLGLAGCGSDGGPDGGAPDGGNRTVAHKFGATAISGTPARVVTVGLTDADYAVAMGTVPVGVREWFGNQPGALWPWAREKAGGATANPGFRGRTALLASVLEDGSYYVYAEGPAPRFLVDLGFALPPATAGIFTGPERAPQQLSRERLALLEADVLLVGLYGDRAAGQFADDPLMRGLRAVREGRTVLMPERSTLNGTLSFGSVLSLPVALSEAVPRIAAALDGNPATAVAPA